jgi:hypothetical protein
MLVCSHLTVTLTPERPYVMASLPTLMLRGALGNALRTYTNRHAHTPMSNRFQPPRLDLYDDVFKAAPSVLLLRPQVWRTEQAFRPDAPVVFELILLQQANRCAAAITAALCQNSFMLAGVSSGQKRQRIAHHVSDIVANETYTLAPLAEDSTPRDVHLTFTTPLAVKVRQTPKKSTIDPAPSASLLVRSHLSRLAALTRVGGWQDILPLDSFAPLENRWQRCRMVKYQDGKGRPFWGVTGEMTIYQVPAEVRAHLQLAEVTHIGKDTNYGFGHIQYRSLSD